jgi:hypothetical protein
MGQRSSAGGRGAASTCFGDGLRDGRHFDFLLSFKIRKQIRWLVVELRVVCCSWIRKARLKLRRQIRSLGAQVNYLPETNSSLV